ncbi:MAG: lysophospholipid acyltransferase family protein [Pseudomonadota bacterium]
MQHDRHIARDISYAYSAQTRGGRAMIRAMESLSGRMGLIKRAKGYEDEVAAGRDFWQVMVERYGLSLDLAGGSMENVPKDGPLILIANHPFGILDGLIMGHILSQTRGDFRILANSVFRKSPTLSSIVIPISFDENPDATALNRRSIHQCARYLRSGGALGVFPSGTVATSKIPLGRAAEALWPATIAFILKATGARVLPVFFHGSNSRLFQIGSHIHNSIRLGLYINEFRRRVDRPVSISIGEPIDPAQCEQFGRDVGQLARFLRHRVMDLGGVDDAIVGKQYLRVI